MKKTCILCGKTKGKRTCQLHQNDEICPVCCATTRQQSCEGCRYYTVARQYQASKHGGSKHFIAEINEEVTRAVEHALALCKNRSFSKAHAILQELLPAHPRNHQVYYALGLYHALQGNDDEALKYLDCATDIFPYFVEAYFNKGVIYKNKQDIKRMINTYQKVIEIGDPQNQTVKQAHEILHGFEQHIREHENITLEAYFKGLEVFERAIEAMNNKKWEQAIDLFQQCIRYFPRYFQSYGNMGICYGQLGQKGQAILALDKAIEIDPKYELAIVNRTFIESLKDGEKISQGKIEMIEYSKDYRRNKKYSIQTNVQQSNNLLP